MNRSRTSPEPAAGAGPRAAGLMVVLTAPSGAGKTTVAARVLAGDPRLAFSVSHTTRAPRPGERDGVDYHFVDEATFDRMVEEGAFAEWAHVHTRRYGTSHEEIRRLREAGRDLLLDIDPQGAIQLMPAYPDAVTVFMVPPSVEALEARLRGRGTEDPRQLAVRLANARREIGEAPRYQYLVVNDALERAVEDFQAILRAERQRTARQRTVLDALLAAPHPHEEPSPR